MNRLLVAELIDRYIDVLDVATRLSPVRYAGHLLNAVEIRARWIGGESVTALKASLCLELHLYLAEPSCVEGEFVGQAFGKLCRQVELNPLIVAAEQLGVIDAPDPTR